jgi:hypothetical protein
VYGSLKEIKLEELSSEVEILSREKNGLCVVFFSPSIS